MVLRGILIVAVVINFILNANGFTTDILTAYSTTTNYAEHTTSINGNTCCINGDIVQTTNGSSSNSTLKPALNVTEVRNLTTEPILFPNTTTTQTTTTEEATIAPDAPPNKPAKPEISVGKYQDKLQFKCFFGEAGSLEYPFYEIKWFKDGVLVSTLTVATADLESVRLLESDIGKLGVTLTCSVRPKYSLNGNPGFPSESNGFYVGIQVNPTSLIIKRSERPAKEIRLTLTVPFLCGTTDTDCTLQVQMYVKSNNHGCNGEITADENSPGCRKLISSLNWNETHTMSVRYKDRGTYYAWSTFTVTFVSYSTLHPIWDNFKFAEIQVTVVDDENIWMGKRCYSQNDPHMKTFDGRMYENQNEGEYILYEHADLKRPMQVQVKYYDCSGGRIFCNCGVAVRAGRDVYVIDMCDGRRIMEYTSCKDNILDVRRSKWNSGLYSIFFPTGTEVIVSVHYNNINVDIVASKHDVKNTRGLCGNLSYSCADDFILRNNGIHSTVDGTNVCYGSWIYPNDFTSSWKELYSASLFNPTYVQSLRIWEDSDKYCTCPSSESDLQFKMGCSTGSVSTCDRDLRYEKVGLAFCESVYNSTSLSNPGIYGTVGRIRRSAMERSSISKVVPDDAVTHCNSTIGGSDAFKACSSVPNVNSDDALEICALDIQLTNSTDWDAQTYEAMKSNCLSELEKNTTLQETDSSGGPSLASIIGNIVCPGLPECSKQGTCENGTCICNKDYIDVDCSVQKSVPPRIVGVRGGGFCDRSEISCNTAYLVAERIASSRDLACKIKPFTITVGGTKQSESETVVNGKQETVVEVYCSVKKARYNLKRSTFGTVVFIEGFDISVSYDRANFSKNSQMYIFDSACQELNVSTETPLFTLKNGTCFISSQCHMDGTINSKDVNLICNSSYPYQWTSIKGLESTWSTSSKFISNFVFILLCVILYALVVDFVSSQ